jgi:hypothetical protein
MGNFPFRACAYPIERALSPLAAEISSREGDELMPPQRWRAIKAVHYLIKYLSNAQDVQHTGLWPFCGLGRSESE